ncbi:NAD(P)/FAD-dependent oxidoreductase [Microbacterium aurantiacum]|uniref:FAD-dependent oxidoreductase n=1 Tax=Microbacterium aurantiacum TaxID=162393 RepID=A0ABT8FVP5_9MICO|nr:FAD-dependent oxidoreductase [Microbacterium aurantiacum]MDN4465386.1 FAD-dependent oxidoreductase [Microbacterium aurantiacum]
MSAGASGIDRLVVVGASLAGMRAVEAARADGFDGEIVLIGDEEHLPYDRPPLSKQLLDEALDVPWFHTETHYRDDLGVELQLGAPAVGIDPERQEIITVDRAVPYDAAVIATGARPRALPGISGLADVTTLRTVDDARRVRGALDEGRRLLIIGGGFIGAEVASAARRRSLPVTVIEASPYPLERALGREMGKALSAMHARSGVDLRIGTSVVELERHGDEIVAAMLSDRSTVACDFVLVSVGAIPNTAWLRESGVALAPDGGVVCDRFLESSLPGVYAAGDIAYFPNSVTGRHGRIEHWTSANEQGALAARNAVGHEKREYSTVPYVWSDWYGNRIQFVGRISDQAPVVVSGAIDESRFIALYRDDDRVVGAVSVNEPGRIMKERRRIAQGASWSEALAAHAAPAH